MDPYYHQTPWEIVYDDNGQILGVVYRLLGGDRDQNICQANGRGQNDAKRKMGKRKRATVSGI